MVKCHYNQHRVHKAFVHVKLSVGTYILQSNKARFNQFQVSKLCPLCNREIKSVEQESAGSICASNRVAAGVIGEHHWGRLDGGRYGTTYTGSVNTADLVKSGR